jgi:hypothetical protein
MHEVLVNNLQYYKGRINLIYAPLKQRIQTPNASIILIKLLNITPKLSQF